MAEEQVRPAEGFGASNEVAETKPDTGATDVVAGAGGQDGATQAKGLEEVQAELRKQRAEFEKDLANLRSVHDRQLNEQRRELEQAQEQFRQKQRAFELEGKDELERLRLENQYALDDITQLRVKLASTQEERQQAETANEWAQAAVAAGLDPTKLDRSDSSALLNSVWNGLLELAKKGGKGAEQVASDMANQTQPVQKTEVAPPPVVTGTGGEVANQTVTWNSELARLNRDKVAGRDNWTMDSVKEAVRRGELPTTIIDNIIRSRAEQLTRASQSSQ